MKIEILHRYTSAVLYAVEKDNLKDAVIDAVKSRADLSGANLYGANLYGANLYGANLSGADLSGANLSGANLSGADLSGADLYGANLSGADLSGADLSGANLYGADLSGANLYGANLYGANLSGADLSGAKNLEVYKHSIVPETGAFIAYKKLANGTIAKLQIPEDAERVGGLTGRKCRASKAIVLEGSGNSKHDSKFTYAVGQIIVPDSWDNNPTVECSHGIHFFITRQEAQEY